MDATTETASNFITEIIDNDLKTGRQSSEDSESVPSTAKQLDFAKYLKHELEEEGLSDVEMNALASITSGFFFCSCTISFLP